MCGAERSTATVAVMVKSVKMMRHSLSTTIAANFQSFLTCTGDRVSVWGCGEGCGCGDFGANVNGSGVQDLFVVRVVVTTGILVVVP